MPKRTYPEHVLQKRAEYNALYHARTKTPEKLRKNAERSRAHYRKNREAILIKYAENREIVNSAKNAPCADCHVQYPPYVMDLDHVRGKKLFCLSAVGARKTDAIIDEIAKCDVVCANCHRHRTHKRKLYGSVV